MRKILALCLLLVASPALAAPANTLRDLSAKLDACFASVKLNTEAEATVVFSLKRNGSLNGKPRITYAKLPPDESRRNGDAAVISHALGGCLPIPVTDSLGGAIAGRVFTLHLGGKRPTDL